MAAEPAKIWLRALERLTAAVAHELRNPLNGVALNLEVLRGRVGRGRGEGAPLVGFADAAAADLLVAIRLTDALLAVARPVRVPVEVGSTLAPIATLASAVAVARGGSMKVNSPDDFAPAVAVDGYAIRGALATVLLAAAERGAEIVCTTSYEPDVVVVEVTGAEIGLPDELASSLESCGIALIAASNGVAMRIPRHAESER